MKQAIGASGGPGGCHYLITWPVKICTTSSDNRKLIEAGIAIVGTTLVIKHWDTLFGKEKGFFPKLWDKVAGAFTQTGEGEYQGDLSNPLVMLTMFALLNKLGIGNAWQSEIPPGGEDIKPSTGGMSTGTMIGLGIAGVLALGLIMFFATKKEAK
jgi:hypothetical protein